MSDGLHLGAAAWAATSILHATMLGGGDVLPGGSVLVLLLVTIGSCWLMVRHGIRRGGIGVLGAAIGVIGVAAIAGVFASQSLHSIIGWGESRVAAGSSMPPREVAHTEPPGGVTTHLSAALWTAGLIVATGIPAVVIARIARRREDLQSHLPPLHRHRQQAFWPATAAMAGSALVVMLSLRPLSGWVNAGPAEPAGYDHAADSVGRMALVLPGATVPVEVLVIGSAAILLVWMAMGTVIVWRRPPRVLQARWVLVLGALTALLLAAAICFDLTALLSRRLGDAPPPPHDPGSLATETVAGPRLAHHLAGGTVALLLGATLTAAVTATWVLARAARRSEIESGARPPYAPRPKYPKSMVRLGRVVAVLCMLPALSDITLIAGADVGPAPPLPFLTSLRVALLLAAVGASAAALVLVRRMRSTRAPRPDSTELLAHRGPHERSIAALVIVVIANVLWTALDRMGIATPWTPAILDCVQIALAWHISWELWDWWPGRPGGANRLDRAPG